MMYSIKRCYNILLTGLMIITTCTAFSQNTLQGKIFDDTGESVIGANVLIKGTSKGTISDIDGSFTIEVMAGETTLIVSYVGYETQEVSIENKNSITITLSSSLSLSEVVVTDWC
ncbi:MAG: carboxypeptidase-like regulatory domain-containing protein [Saprospiraceae bacterium]